MKTGYGFTIPDKRLGRALMTGRIGKIEGYGYADSVSYRSKLEAAYATYLNGLKLAGDIDAYAYEAVTLRLARGVSYTPDFYIRFPNGRVEWHEIKGWSKRLLAKEGMVKLKMAARVWRHWTFALVTRYRGQWQVVFIVN